MTTPSKHSIYIEGIPYDTSKQELMSAIASKCEGLVDLRFPTWQDSGRSRGYAHCDFSSEKQMERAIKALDGFEMASGEGKKPRYLAVSKAKTSQRDDAEEEGGGAWLPPAESDGDESKNSASLFLKNLPYDVTESELRSSFLKYGKIASTRLARWNHTQKLKGFGYVTFVSKQDAINAVRSMRKNGPLEIRGRKMRIDYDRGAPKRGFKDAMGRDWHKSKEAKASELGKIVGRGDDDDRKKKRKKVEEGSEEEREREEIRPGEGGEIDDDGGDDEDVVVREETGEKKEKKKHKRG